VTGVVQCETTTGSREEADAIARALVEGRLAACVQVVGPIASTYRWDGDIQADEEWLLRVKTTAEHAGAVKAAIARLHSYDVPEVLVFAVADGAQGYLDWVRTEVAR
jgi:periplasmic divalent cation tolerance protein